MTFSSRDEPRRPVLNATRARQGRMGRPVFWVLVFGTLLAALGLFAAWTWQGEALSETGPSTAERAASAATFDSPDPPPATVPSQ